MHDRDPTGNLVARCYSQISPSSRYRCELCLSNFDVNLEGKPRVLASHLPRCPHTLESQTGDGLRENLRTEQPSQDLRIFLVRAERQARVGAWYLDGVRI